MAPIPLGLTVMLAWSDSKLQILKGLLMQPLSRIFMHCLVATGLTFTTSLAYADTFPEKPVRIIVPYAPGGGADMLSRVIGQKLGDSWNQAVIVENRPGAGGSVGTEYTANAAADGYTLLMASPSHTINPALFSNLGFDPVADFSAVTMAASGPLVMVVPADHPANSVDNFIEQAKQNPGTINYASAGIGSSPHIAGELFNLLAEVDLVHVPYKGTGPALTDLLGKRVDMMFAPVPAIIEHVRSGRLRALGVTTADTFPALPTVPAIADTVPDYEVLQWWGLVVPSGTPEAIISQLNTDIGQALRSPDILERLEQMGALPGGQPAAEFDALIKEEVSKWADLVRAANVQAQ